jgi:hypothetical protein
MLVYNRLKLDEKEKKFLEHMRKVAELIDTLYERQNGLLGLYEKIPAEDTASRRVFARNRSIACEGPKTEKDPACRAIAGMDKVPVDVYRAELQKKDGFCKELAQHKNEKVRDPFTVVRMDKDQLLAVPYSSLCRKHECPSRGAQGRADALIRRRSRDGGVFERGAQEFQDNTGLGRRKMGGHNGRNSKWYVRVGPDETFGALLPEGGFHCPWRA